MAEKSDGLMKLFFLIPVYNEAPNIEALSKELKACLPEENKFFLFVDDCSKDNTIELINRHFEGTGFYVLTKKQNEGPGHSFNIGFEWLLEHSQDEKDLFITMEANTTSDISILSRMVTISKLGYELVLASVYAQGGGFEKTSLFRKIISLSANMVFRSMFNIKVLTLSSFYRIYHPSLLKRIRENYSALISEKGFICMLEILMKSVKVHASVIEVPMILKSDRREGKSKMKIFRNTMRYIRFLFFSKH